MPAADLRTAPAIDNRMAKPSYSTHLSERGDYELWWYESGTVDMVRSAVEKGAFGRGPFSVAQLDDVGRLLFGGVGRRTFLNRQFFHHELIHVSQILKNPSLWSKLPLRLFHVPIQLLTAHGVIGWPSAIAVGWWIKDDIFEIGESLWDSLRDDD